LRKPTGFTVFLAPAFLLFIILCSSLVFYEVNALSSSTTTISTSGSISQAVASTFLHTSGTNIYDSNNEQVIWNGIVTKTLLGYEMYASAGVLPEDLSTTDIDTISSHGLNFVRLGIALCSAVYGQDYHNQTPTKLNYYPRFWNLLDSIVNEAQTHGMWVDITFMTTDFVWSGIGGYWGVGNGFPTWMYNGSWSYFNKIYTNDAAGRSDAIRDFWNINDGTAANVRTAYQTFWKDFAYHFRNTPNVVFSLYNEPQNKYGGPELWDSLNGHPTQTQGAQMYESFMENTIDIIRSQDNGKHVILINDAYFWSYSTNPQIQRPNIVVECHSYSGVSTSFFNLGWRYNQPFYVGEFGGIEQGLQSESATISVMQTCNSYNVSWCYLRYNNPATGGSATPSVQTWTDLRNNLNPDLTYCS
jgi:hypothetical protein